MARQCALAFGPLLVSACAAGPDYHAPQPVALGVPASYSVPSPAASTGTNPRWWAVFGDSLLTGLEEQGIAPNLDLALAFSRLRQAREALVQAGSAGVPAVTVASGFTRTEGNFSASNFALSGDASYQVDLFGGRARSIEAARADAQASAFSYDAVLISVRAELAYAYFQTRLAQANLANALLSQQQQRDNLQLAQWRNQAGLIGSLDVELARSQLAQTSATIPQIEASLNAAMARIAVLTGQAPGALKAQLRMAAPIPIGPDSIAAGIPADILRQRPDLRAAERNLAAATARIGVAQAQLYPALTLGGTLGTSSASLGGLFDVASGQAFASLAQTLLDGGRRRSVMRGQRAAAQGALASYHQNVLLALEEAENAMVALRSAKQRAEDFATAQAAANQSALLARQQYGSGLIDYIALLTAERLLVTAQNGLAQARYDQAAAVVQLYTALGGGWQLGQEN